mgnify:CR=1 FL=1
MGAAAGDERPQPDDQIGSAQGAVFVRHLQQDLRFRQKREVAWLLAKGVDQRLNGAKVAAPGEAADRLVAGLLVGVVEAPMQRGANLRDVERPQFAQADCRPLAHTRDGIAGKADERGNGLCIGTPAESEGDRSAYLGLIVVRHPRKGRCSARIPEIPERNSGRAQHIRVRVVGGEMDDASQALLRERTFGDAQPTEDIGPTRTGSRVRHRRQTERLIENLAAPDLVELRYGSPIPFTPVSSPIGGGGKKLSG